MGFCEEDENSSTSIYIVTLKQTPTVLHNHFNNNQGLNLNVEMEKKTKDLMMHRNGSYSRLITKPHKPRNWSRSNRRYAAHISRVHDSLLKKALKGENYLKLYSYHYLINGFAVLVTPEQAEKLSSREEVANVILDYRVRTETTHTPEFLGLPGGAWVQEGGPESAGEGIVIGFVDTGIDPTHPSFSDNLSGERFTVPTHFTGMCEVTMDFPSGSCNRKLIGARHFAASAITRGIFNALYKSFGGFAADVVAAIDQAAQDGVDIISLSITPNRRPPGVATFFNPIDMALLSAVKAGIFVVQAAGNTGPSPKSMSSFSPWIFTVGAAAHDRTYSNSLILGNNATITGVGLAPGTNESTMYTLVSALHALNNDTQDATNLYVNECQDPSILDTAMVQGNLLMCSYSIRFVLGLSTIKQALETAKNLTAVGVVFYMDPYVIGFQINPTPMDMPGIIIPSASDSKILFKYYNSSLEQDLVTNKVKFGATATILGGLEANYSSSAPKVMYYSARGPDPEDSFLDDADILKPNVIAPGSFIWGAWSSVGTDSIEFQDENFAMMSGTSMAAPHIAGLAALVKQKFPGFSPSAIGSALSTTASMHNKKGEPIMAQRAYANPDLNQSPATPFDMGSGFVDVTSALDPGLIFDSSYDDYFSFLCGINGSGPVVLNYTSQNCGNLTINGRDLNLPSITIAKLNQSTTVERVLTNIAGNETYNLSWFAPYGVKVLVTPRRFFIESGQKQVITVSFNATMNSSAASFGRISLYGSQRHIISVPLSVIYKISYNRTDNS
ncbi:hypothetical protein MKW94_023960 [Papaver nudicaule]|uniref:Uncharacterized protein n=1 Tax=Papaver nudicaule TaxID=74823 RepID=A0AA41RVP8_PAPNU|nr:hypothetical protein [Papaver nudicaule]